MLADTNRIGAFSPNPFGFGTNIVGSGAEVLFAASVAEPATLSVLAPGILAVAPLRRQRRNRRTVRSNTTDCGSPNRSTYVGFGRMLAGA